MNTEQASKNFFAYKRRILAGLLGKVNSLEIDICWAASCNVISNDFAKTSNLRKLQDLDNKLFDKKFENENMYGQEKLTAAENSAVPILKKSMRLRIQIYEIEII